MRQSLSATMDLLRNARRHTGKKKEETIVFCAICVFQIADRVSTLRLGRASNL